MICTAKHATAQNDTFHVRDFRVLGETFFNEGNFLLSYFNNLNYYHLSDNSAEKLNAGIQALEACIRTENFELAEDLVFIMGKDYPEVVDYLKYKYAYSLSLSHRYSRANLYLNSITEKIFFDPQYSLLQAYNRMNLNQIRTSIRYLENAMQTQSPYIEQLGDILSLINSGPENKAKSPVLSLFMSAIIPGTGQLYNGFYYDAARSFGLNALFGYATYASWKYELSRDKINYVLPVSSTMIFAVFYLTNIYNTINLNRRANMYYENQFYRGVLNRFEVIINDQGYFFGLMYEF